MNAEERCEETSDSDCSEVLCGEISVKSLQLIQRQHDAEKIYQDPQSIENVVPIWTLCKYFASIT